MRRTTLKQRGHLTRHAADCLKRALLWKEYRRVKRGGPPPEKVTVFREGKRQRAWAYAKTLMPSVFCLDNNIEETLAFLATARVKLLGDAAKWARSKTSPRLSRYLRTYFDFASIKSISPTAALEHFPVAMNRL